jgi:hypothetical protein
LLYFGAHGLCLVSKPPSSIGLDASQRKTGHSQGKIERFTKLVSESAIGIKAALRIGQVFYNRAHFFVTGVFDGQDRRRRDEDGERERSQVC